MKYTYKLTEGAILLAIFAVLLMITLYIPVLSLVINFFLAFPFIFFAAKHDRKSTVVFTLSAVLLSILLGSFLAIPLALLYGSTGAVMGIWIREGKSRLAVTAAGTFTFLINAVADYAISVAFFQFNIIKKLFELFRNALDESGEMLTEMGQLPDEKVIKQFESVIDIMETLVPSLFVLSAFFGVFVIQLVSMPLLSRFGINPPKWMPFREMSLPKSLLWYYLFTMLAALAIAPEEGTYWFTALANLSFILQMLMVMQGLSLIFYITHVKGYPKAVPVIVTVLSFITPFVLYIVRILGIIDLGFELRKRLTEKK